MKEILLFILLFTFLQPSFGQDNINIPQRTAEQEALKQTEKLQQELNLTSEQAKQVYDINLKYAHERQISNSRSAAMERMKNKNADIELILNQEQSNRLQSKRDERSQHNSFTTNRNANTPLSSVSTSENRRIEAQRITPSNRTTRNSYRSTAPLNYSVPARRHSINNRVESNQPLQHRYPTTDRPEIQSSSPSSHPTRNHPSSNELRKTTQPSTN